MSDFTVRWKSPSQSDVTISPPSGIKRVVTQDSGKNVTLSSFRQVETSISELSDVNMNSNPNGSVLIFNSSTSSFTLRPLGSVDGSGDLTIDNADIDGGTF